MPRERVPGGAGERPPARGSLLPPGAGPPRGPHALLPAAALRLLALAAAGVSGLLLALPLAFAASSRAGAAAEGEAWLAAGRERGAGALLRSDVLHGLRSLLDLLVSLGAGYLLVHAGLVFGRLIYLLPALCVLAERRP